MNEEQQSRQPGILKRFVIAYLRGIDAVLRLVGTSAIIALLYGVLQPPFSRPPIRPHGCFRGLTEKANS
jgi:hypothetical protein